ncbi:MAG: ABC transporter permease [Hyphomicrobiales bacterium]|uniref:cell division protein FtsX n=1 Tax=Nisaea sp. TaxID=2024842 RepID=UPI0032889EF6
MTNSDPSTDNLDSGKPKSALSSVVNFMLAVVRLFARWLGGNRLPKSSPIVPPQSVAGTALMAVIAIMSFLACLTLAAVTMVFEQAQLWESDVSSELTVQIRPSEGVDMELEIERAIRITEQSPGVGRAEAITEDQSAELLEPWLGAGLDLSELPVPRLLVVEIDNPVVLDIAKLRKSLIEAVAGVSVDDHGIWINQLKRIANVTIATGIGIFLLVLAATCLSVIFATRGAMAGNQVVISVLHFVGALNRYIAREFQGRFLLIGLQGGLVGCFAATVFFVVGGMLLGFLEGPSGGSPFQALFGGFALTPLVFAGFVFVLILVSALTAMTTRMTVERYLATVQ